MGTYEPTYGFLVKRAQHAFSFGNRYKCGMVIKTKKYEHRK